MIEIEATNAPTAVHLCSCADPAGACFVREGQLPPVAIQRKSLPVEVSNKEILQTISVVIGRIHTHTRTRVAIGRISYSRLESNLLEPGVPAIDEQEIRNRVIGNKQIQQSVVVDIRSHRAEDFAFRVSNSRRLRDVGKGA